MYQELDLIEKIKGLFPTPAGVTLGIGDDCAILERGRFDLVTTDSLVENVHFRRDWSCAEDIGWKIVARCISDIAAMGGQPGAFFLNLILGSGDDRVFVDGLLQGMHLASCELTRGLRVRDVQVSVVGGDVSATSGPTVLAMMLLGSSPEAGAVLRSGARAGDRIVLLGPTGLSGAAVDLLSGKIAADPDDYPELLAAHRRPRPRAGMGALLGERGLPSAMIDLSDGLARDLMHILAKSEVGARIELEKLPRHAALERLAKETATDILPYILAGGDDYELLMAMDPSRMAELVEVAGAEGCDVYDIGEILDAQAGLKFVDSSGEELVLESVGYQHFEAP